MKTKISMCRCKCNCTKEDSKPRPNPKKQTIDQLTIRHCYCRVNNCFCKSSICDSPSKKFYKLKMLSKHKPIVEIEL